MCRKWNGAWTAMAMIAGTLSGGAAERFAAGKGHSLAVDGAGEVRAWGDGRQGQLGNGQFAVHYAPTHVLGPDGTGRLENVVQVQAGRNHSLAVTADGQVWAWGENTYGQLGDGRWGMAARSAVPVRVLGPEGDGALEQVVAVAAGWDHSVALLRDGTVWAWGSRCQGQLGDGSRDANRWSVHPVQVAAPGGENGLAGITAIACGAFHTLARRQDGSLLAWGGNHEGQLGRGDQDGRMYRLQGELAWTARPGTWRPALGYTYTDPSHRRVASRLQLVDEFDGPALHVTEDGENPRPLVANVSRRRDHVAMTARLEYPDRTRPGQTIRLNLPEILIGQHAGDDDFAEDIHLLLVEQDTGEQVRLDLTGSRDQEANLPVPVVGLDGSGRLGNVRAIAAGVYHSVALLEDGTVCAWGYNGTGQLGDGSRRQRSFPRLVAAGAGEEGPLGGIVAIAAGYEHTLARNAAGRIWACGWNVYGQLGGAVSPRSPGGFPNMLPVQRLRDGDTSPLAGVTAFASGVNHVLARDAEGDLLAWGHNGYGQLADGSLMDRVAAVPSAALATAYQPPPPRLPTRPTPYPTPVERHFPDPQPGDAGVVNVRDRGATGDGTHLDQEVLQTSLDAAHAAGGGIVLVPPGVYRTGPLELPSRVRLHLAEGATLLASTNRDHYPEGRSRPGIIMAAHVEDIAVTGGGVIDGQGHFAPNRGWRPRVISFENCRNVTIEGVTTKNSGSWTQHYVSCHNLTIRGVTVNSVRPRRNNDGMDFSGCQDVLIEGCLVAAEDDTICIKSHRADQVNRNIRAIDNTVYTMCNGFKLGTETRGDFEDILCRDLRAYGGSSLAVWSVDGANVRNVLIENVRAEDSRFALGVCLGERLRASYFAEGEERVAGSMRDVVMRDIDVVMAERSFRDTLLDHGIENAELAHQLWVRDAEPSFVVGLPGRPVQGVLLEDVRISYPGGGSAEDALVDVPERPRVYPNAGMYGTLPAWGLFLRHAEGVTLRNVQLELRAPDARPPLKNANLAEGELVIENLAVHED